MNRWNHNPPKWDFEPALPQHNLAQARGILARLYNLELSSVVEHGPCRDCKQPRPLRQYGHVRICFRCERNRIRAQENAA